MQRAGQSLLSLEERVALALDNEINRIGDELRVAREPMEQSEASELDAEPSVKRQRSDDQVTKVQTLSAADYSMKGGGVCGCTHVGQCSCGN